MRWKGFFAILGVVWDMVPAQFRVLVTIRPKYACRSCEEGVIQAPAPTRLIEGGMPTEATIAQVLVSKYADHLPLYRQAQIYTRQGIDLDRSTLADWVGHAAWHLRPLHERLLMRLKSSGRLFADETTVPVLDPGRGRTKTGQLWAYVTDDRPWARIRSAPRRCANFWVNSCGRAEHAVGSRQLVAERLRSRAVAVAPCGAMEPCCGTCGSRNPHEQA
jgi:transposase